MSIIEDANNLTPGGRAVCLALFVLGCLVLAVTGTQFGRLTPYLQSTQENMHQQASLINNPAEIDSPFPQIPVQSEENRINRIKIINEKLGEIAGEMAAVPTTNAKKFIQVAVTKGYIHPKEGLDLLEEIEILQTKTPEPKPEAPKENE